MSDLAKALFDGLHAMKAGLQTRLQEAGSEIGTEISRLGTQGAMELASALFSGHTFVPYGPGQYTPSPEHQPDHQPELEHNQDNNRGIER